ncbi:methyltransferase, partial [Bacteroidales bacterium OttesenSCG-928-K22]|nr:methyltransferase [Bacteroidales bacterium OttesenSCG-928-K22]
MIFKFQQFELSHSKSTMRVGTDAVVLGGYLSKLIADKENISKILDIGTGCGVLALISAQKFPNAEITAIDIDENSFNEATENFINSPWSNRMETKHISLQNFHQNHKKKFDLIISNPPYFENSLKSGNQLKDLARHNDNLPFNVLAFCVEELMSKEGKFICILPTSEARGFIRTALIEGLFCNQTVEIFSKGNDENPKRMILVFQKNKEERINDRFVIGDE